MKRIEEYNLAKRLLNEIVDSNNHNSIRSKEEIIRDLVDLQKKDVIFIKTMLLYSCFYNINAKRVYNIRVIDFFNEDIRAFQLISYLELIDKVKEITNIKKRA